MAVTDVPKVLADALRIAVVAPVAQSVPPDRSGSIESLTALLVDGLVARGHDVTLFATGSSVTTATLHAIYPRGYNEDSSLWPWDLCELFNLAAAMERAMSFDVIHYQAEYYPMSLAYGRLSPTPILQTLHHAPTAPEVRALVPVRGRAVCRGVHRAGAPAGRPQRRGHDSPRGRHQYLRVSRES